jgi:hypothetical protein
MDGQDGVCVADRRAWIPDGYSLHGPSQQSELLSGALRGGARASKDEASQSPRRPTERARKESNERPDHGAVG